MTSHVGDLLDRLAPFVVLVALAWALKGAFGAKMRHGGRVKATVYCLHCNWEGRVARASMSCGSCGSQNLSVLAI